jgi:23S rRNA (guanosine2251-2'-O)-methyltransferase
VWGWHAALAALENPRRGRPRQVLATPDRARQLLARRPDLEGRMAVLESGEIGRRLPAGAVHQGVAMDIAAPAATPLDELAAGPAGVLVMLDQVTDPQNVGAVFRSAAAFGARGVIVQSRHAPAFGGTLAKAAAGGLDRVPFAEVVNLSRALESLAEAGWRAVGLDGAGPLPLAEALDGSPTVIVLGAEGEGLRRLVAEHCETLARIPMPGGLESLNVAAAAAIALYEATRGR